MKTRLLQAAVLFATIAVIAIHWLAATGGINNKTPEQVSTGFTTEITPAGYAFAIWSLIYLGLIAFTIFQLLPAQTDNQRLNRIRLPYIISCLANIGWIYTWHYELIPLSLVCMIALLISLISINHSLFQTETAGELWLARIPFSIYFGWITVATILNVTIALVYWGVSFSAFVTAIIGVLVVVAATILGIIIRFKLDTMLYPITIAWGLTAIGVEQSGDTAVTLATALGMMALIFVGLWGYIKDR